MAWELAAAGFALAFAPTYAFLPRLIRALKKRPHLLRADLNKAGKPGVPGFGGIAMVTGYLFSVSTLVIVLRSMHEPGLAVGGIELGIVLSGMLSMALIALLGLVDDVLEIPRRFVKPFLCLYASIPMMALAGLDTAVRIPFNGTIELGAFYLFGFVPLAIIFCSNAVNILSTYNGIEAGMAAWVAFGLMVVAAVNGSMMGMLLAAPLLAVLLAFYAFNRYPSRVFPGNMGTLFMGAALAVTAILGKMEGALVVMMVPYGLHFLLYARNGFAWKPNMWGVLQPDGTLKSRYRKAYGLMQWLLLRKPLREKEVVHALFGLEAFFVAAAIALAWAGAVG